MDTDGRLAVRIEKSEVFGAFEVSLDGELLYSKKHSGRLPHPGEVENLVMERLHKQ